MEIAIGIVIGICTGAVMILINALVRRVGMQSRSDRLEIAIEDLKKEQKVILQVLLPLVLAVNGEKPNGELHRALQLLNEYMINK